MDEYKYIAKQLGIWYEYIFSSTSMNIYLKKKLMYFKIQMSG